MIRDTAAGEYEWPSGRRGVAGVHADACGVRDGEPCTCGPLGYRASARDPDGGRRVSPLLESEAAAASWLRTRTRTAARPHPTRAVRAPIRVREVGDDFLSAARDGRVRDAGGRRYSDDALDELHVALRGHVAEELGDVPLGALRRWQVQGFVNELADSGLSVQRLHAIVAALRAVAQYGHEEGIIEANPIDGVTVPSGEDREPRPFTTTDQLTAVTPAAVGQFIPDQMLWQLVKVVTIVFVLIALVLAAESI